jgi:hypothetical protein
VAAAGRHTAAAGPHPVRALRGAGPGFEEVSGMSIKKLVEKIKKY